MNLSLRKSGKGEAVLLLHGFCENKDLWQAFESQLSRQYQTVVVDLPGFGESTANPHYQSVEAMAREVHQAITGAGIGQGIVIGHSLGGYVALAFAELFPQFVKGLGLFHSTAYADSEEKKHTRNKTADFIEKKGLEPFLENFIPPLFFEGRRNELATQIEAYWQLARKTPKATAIAATKAMRDRPDRTHVLLNATYPVLFITGKEDKAVPLEGSKDQFFLPKDCTLHLIAETAHMGMYEHEAQTMEMVEAFVRRVAAAQTVARSTVSSVSPPY